MKLYYVPNTCALATDIALREAKLPFTLDRIDLKAGKKTQSGADYLSINPKGSPRATCLPSSSTTAPCSPRARSSCSTSPT
jgi:glutathione S-transferase